MKNKKMVLGLSIVVIICLIIWLIASSASRKVAIGDSDIYPVKVTKVSNNDLDEWTITGETNAPDNAKIICVGKKTILKDNAAKISEDVGWAKVQDGKFKVDVDPTDIYEGAHAKKGQNIQTYFFAITNYHKKYDGHVDRKYLDAFSSKYDFINLKLSSSQAKGLGYDDADNSDDEASNSESDSFNSSNSYQDSLDARKDNWNSSSDGDIIHVAKIWQDMHTTFVAVNEDDWDSLSETDKNNFTSDWTSSIQDIYKMSDKNGTTSIQVVSDNNHDHMLAHSNGSGNVKVDD